MLLRILWHCMVYEEDNTIMCSSMGCLFLQHFRQWLGLNAIKIKLFCHLFQLFSLSACQYGNSAAKSILKLQKTGLKGSGGSCRDYTMFSRVYNPLVLLGNFVQVLGYFVQEK